MNKIMRIVVPLFLIFVMVSATPLSAASDDLTVTFNVVDGDGNPVEDALIVVVWNPNDSTANIDKNDTTDADGYARISFEVVDTGELSVHVSKQGYNDFTNTYTLHENSTSIDIELSDDPLGFIYSLSDNPTVTGGLILGIVVILFVISMRSKKK